MCRQARYRSSTPPRAMFSSFSKMVAPASRMPQCRYSLVIHCKHGWDQLSGGRVDQAWCAPACEEGGVVKRGHSLLEHTRADRGT